MIRMRASAELQQTFEKLIQAAKVPVRWNGVFVAVDNYMILQGEVRSLFFHFDTRKVYASVIEIPEKEEVREIGDNQRVRNAINMILYAFGKWGTLKGVRVDKDDSQLQSLFTGIMQEYGVEPEYTPSYLRFYRNGMRITYEDAIQFALEYEEETEQEARGGGLWHKMIWKKVRAPFTRVDTTEAERKKERLGNNFYMVGYLCPDCGKNLHMVVYPEGKEFLIETEEGGVRIARAATCAKCRSFFTPRPKKLFADGDVYVIRFEEDAAAYEDYLGLLGSAGERVSNRHCNEYADGRKMEDEEREETLEKLSASLPELTDAELQKLVARMEEGFYSDAGIRKIEHEIERREARGGRYEEGDAKDQSTETLKNRRKERRTERDMQESDCTAEYRSENDTGESAGRDHTSERGAQGSGVPAVWETKRDVREAGSKTWRTPERSLQKSDIRAEQREAVQKTAGGGTQSEYLTQERQTSRNNPENTDVEEARAEHRETADRWERQHGERAGGTAGARTDKGDPKDRKLEGRRDAGGQENAGKSGTFAGGQDDGQAAGSRQEMERRRRERAVEKELQRLTERAKAAEGKNCAVISRIYDEVKRAAVPEEEKRPILEKLAAQKVRQAEQEVGQLIRQMPDHRSRQQYKQYMQRIRGYGEVDLSPYEELLRERQESAERYEIADMVKRARKSDRKDLENLLSRLHGEDFLPELVFPYEEKIRDRIREADAEAIAEICPNPMAMTFEDGMKAYEQIQAGEFLPELKQDALNQLTKRLAKIKTDECELLVQKLKEEMADAGIAENPRHYFYPARKALLHQADPKELDLIEFALASYAAGRGMFEYPVFVTDTTHGGSGKEGIILTPEHLYYSTLLSAYGVPVSSIAGIEGSTGFLKKGLYMRQKDGTKTKLPYAVEHGELAAFAGVLDSFIHYLQEKPDSRSLAYLASERHEKICCYRCGYEYQGGAVCPKCGYRNNT